MRNKYDNIYPEVNYGGFTRTDTTIDFYTRIHSLITSDMIIVDYGCGRGSAIIDEPNCYKSKIRNFKGHCQKVIGIDLDVSASSNPNIDEFIHLENPYHIPLEDGSIDVILCDFVLEHINNPLVFEAEIRRILKPGGLFCARTTNKLGYVAFGSRIIPERMHQKLLKKLQPFRKTEDIFKTFYKMNSKKELNLLFQETHWQRAIWGVESEQNYFLINTFLFHMMTFIMKICPNNFKNSILIFARKLQP